MAAAREPEVVPAVLAARRGGVGQPHDAARLLAHFHLAAAAAAARAATAARAAAARHLRADACLESRTESYPRTSGRDLMVPSSERFNTFCTTRSLIDY